MALPPHVIWNRIQSISEGEEKEKKIRSFHNHIQIAMWIQLFGIIAMAVLIACLTWKMLI